MLAPQPVWMRGLWLYESATDGSTPAAGRTRRDEALDARVHARSRFRSVRHPERYAVYSVHDADPRDGSPSGLPGEHTLIVVREFRRVPLHASALALLVFTALGGSAALVLAALARFVERAVSLYRPAYLLLARSLEQPGMSTLLMGMHERAAQQEVHPSALSLDTVLPQLSPLLSCEPEWYAYCPEVPARGPWRAISPYAV